MTVGGQIVRLVRSGGFAGLTMSAVVPVAELPADAQAVLIDAPPATRTKRAAGADRFTFELTIPVGRRTRTYRFSEEGPPPGLEPVVSHLSRQLAPGD